MKHLFFDLDHTLTPSRQVGGAEMLQLLQVLGNDYDLIVVSGSTNQQIMKQLPEINAYLLGQNGNHAQDKQGNELWMNSLIQIEKNLIIEHIESLKPLIKHPIPNHNDLVEDRGSQISFSIYGHNAHPEEKAKIDPYKTLRKSYIDVNPFVSDTLEVFMGGSTCFDYVKKGFHKGNNVRRLITDSEWNLEECIYFGDALMPGGNDETVVGVIPTVAVDNENHTYDILKNNYLRN